MTDISNKEVIQNPYIEQEREDEPTKNIQQETSDSSDIIIQFELGDIIQINAPSNQSINDMIFVINYIDETKIKLINVINLSTTTLNILPSGKLSDESIQSISILSRPETPGYAQQNKLLPKTWIDIYFGGDLPVTITGQITNLEDDMIEIKTFPDEQIIYIDFAYRGIPENIPIERINIRTPPSSIQLSKVTELSAIPESQKRILQGQGEGQGEGEEFPIGSASIQGVEVLEQQPEIPYEQVKTVLKEILLEADQIEFGEDLEVIKQTIEVPEEQKRFSIEKQCNDLLNELLSTVPSDKRTRNVMQNINTIINRFKQLREEFSTIDKNGNIVMPKRKEEDYKPLVDTLINLNKKLFWIIPVVKNKKKIYIEEEEANIDIEEQISDVSLMSESADVMIDKVNKIQDSFKSGEDSFTSYLTKINNEFTPFSLPDYTDNLLTVKSVNDNLNAVVNNLENFYSSIFKNNFINKRKFVIQTYNLALNKLDTKDSKGSRMRAFPVKLTDNDKMAVSSFMTLPESTITYSHINLPMTNILDRASLNMNHINYWELLRQNTNVNVEYIDNLNTPIYFDPETMLQSIKTIVLNEDITDNDKFVKFIQLITPTTNAFFEMSKKYINGKISLTDVLHYLEPFMIYQNDINNEQYIHIVEFINERIINFKKEFIANSREFKKLSNTQYMKLYSGVSLLYNLLSSSKTNILANDVLELYGFTREQYIEPTNEEYKKIKEIELSMAMENPSKRLSVIKEIGSQQTQQIMVGGDGNYNNDNDNVPNTVLSNSELLYKILIVDKTRLYMNAIALSNIDLITPFDFDSLYDQEGKIFNERMTQENKENKCKNYVLTKKYIDADELNEDNGIDVYYDKSYDFTDYGFLKKHSKKQLELSPADFISYLKDKYMKDTNMDLSDASREIEDIMRGKRLVRDGQYAVLEINDGESYDYYIRKNNTWVRDETIPSSTSLNDTSYFCNIRDNCFTIDKKCMDNNLASDFVKNDIIKQMENEFDIKYHESRDRIINLINKKYNYDAMNIIKLEKLDNKKLYKYNNIQYVIGADEFNIENIEKQKGKKEIIISPHARLRDLILGETDYVKKQKYIMRFARTFTRKSDNPYSDEENAWLYCIETGVKLLPSFLETIASAFLNKGDVVTVIDTICKERGQMSEDGDSWVDKYSGYIIKKIDLDIEEGYDESGFKLHTREIMEMNMGTALLQSQKEKLEPVFSNQEAQISSNIITTLANYMGIDIEHQRKFIIDNVMIIMDTLKNEEVYKKSAELFMKTHNKAIAPYKDYRNSTLLLSTLAFLITSIQFSIPSVKTRKTFPGCIRSFVGYPIDNEGDDSTIKYIACISLKLDNTSSPWNTLKRTSQDSLITKIKSIIDKYIVSNPIIQTKFAEKREYLLLNVDEEIPIEHDIKKWINYLPPLVELKMKTPQPPSSDFKGRLLEDLKKGSKDQDEKINVLRSKIIQFSLSIQELIHKVVKSEKAILTNNVNEPFLENACCNKLGSINTIQYFVSKEPEIVTYDTQVVELSNIIEDIISAQTPCYLYDESNTRIKYPTIPDNFDEKTIYLAFITFCKFNTHISIPENLQILCHEKPRNYNSDDTLSDRIKQIKNNRIEYTEKSLEALLQIVNENNIIHLNLNEEEISFVQTIRELLNNYERTQNNQIPIQLQILLKQLLDTFDMTLTEDTDTMRDLKNYLGDSNITLSSEIMTFITSNCNLDKTRKEKIASILNNIMDFEEIGNDILMTKNDNSTYKAMQFTQNCINNIINIFPQMIINNVSFKDIKISKHWELSNIHMKDIQNIVERHYNKLNKFLESEDTILLPILQNIKQNTNEWYKLALNTPLLAEIKNSKTNEGFFSVFNDKIVKLLYTFYFLNILYTYIRLSNDKNLIKNDTIIIPREDPSELISIQQAEDENAGQVNEFQMISGKQIEISKELALLLASFLEIIENDKRLINVTTKSIKEDITRTKDKEKDEIVTRLGDLSIEERKVENLKKNLGLGDWGKIKGLVVYETDTYEKERRDMEKRIAAEKKLKKKDYVSDMNIDIYMRDMEADEAAQAEIDAEVYDLTGIGEDDEPFMEENDDGAENIRDAYDDY